MKNEEFFESNPATFDTIFSKELHLDYNGIRTGRWEFGGKSRTLKDIMTTWVSYDYAKLEHVVLDSLSAMESWRKDRINETVFREQHMKNWSLPEVDEYTERQRRKYFDPDPVKEFARKTCNV